MEEQLKNGKRRRADAARNAGVAGGVCGGRLVHCRAGLGASFQEPVLSRPIRKCTA